MAGGVPLGLTSQTSVATVCGSDRISVGNPARPYTSDRYGAFKKSRRMMRQLTILTSLLLIFLTSYGQTDTVFKKADHYKTKKFDVAIFPANYHDLIGGQRFTPTRADIDIAEHVLRTDLKDLNKDLVNQTSTPIIQKKLNKYKRQYFGYIDKNGDRILLINCFWSKDKDEHDRWLQDRITVLDGGSYYWRVKFNLDKRGLFELNVNGYA